MPGNSRIRESQAVRNERDEISATRSALSAGTHYCENCFQFHTPSANELEVASGIGKRPKCPVCSQRQLVRADGSGDRIIDTDNDVERFERRRDRYDRS